MTLEEDTAEAIEHIWGEYSCKGQTMMDKDAFKVAGRVLATHVAVLVLKHTRKFLELPIEKG